MYLLAASVVLIASVLAAVALVAIWIAVKNRGG